ncbi:unnamed protein product, partial [Linum tenue]
LIQPIYLAAVSPFSHPRRRHSAGQILKKPNKPFARFSKTVCVNGASGYNASWLVKLLLSPAATPSGPPSAIQRRFVCSQTIRGRPSTSARSTELSSGSSCSRRTCSRKARSIPSSKAATTSSTPLRLSTTTSRILRLDFSAF